VSEAVTITITGIPRPGGSKTAFRNKYSGKVNMVDSGKGNTGWKTLVAYTARQQYQGQPLDGPLRVMATFFMPRPRGHFNAKGILKASAPTFPTTKPDATKLWRSTEDALSGVLWVDDARIVSQGQAKVYAVGQPGAIVTVEAMK